MYCTCTQRQKNTIIVSTYNMAKSKKVIALRDNQCNFFIEKKKRYCGMTRQKNLKYCIEHQNLIHVIKNNDNNNNNDHNNNSNNNGNKRIPCPLDPNHSVWEHSLSKHLTKCNKFINLHQNDNEVHYQKDLNCGVGPIPNDIVISDNILLKAIELIEMISINEFAILPFQEKCNGFMDSTRLKELKYQKHAIQQSSLIQNMIEFGMVKSYNNINNNSNSVVHNNYTFIEFGCGRAEFSRYVNRSFIHQYNNTIIPGFVLIDRASNRMKFDNKIISDSQQQMNDKTRQQDIKRYKIDIKDLKLDSVLSADTNYIAISKHLCGVATDLTLRCIANSNILSSNLNGVCIAMCCRHVCNSKDYINPNYIKSLITKYDSTLSYEEFFICMKKMCSWATNGKRPGVQDIDRIEIMKNKTVSVRERENLGLVARRVIDQGRLLWVNENLKSDEAKLINYVTKDISLENVALLLRT